MSGLQEQLKWWQEHAEALDRNWAAHHESCLAPIREAIGKESIPEIVHEIQRLKAKIKEMEVYIEQQEMDYHDKRWQGEY